MPTRMKIGRNDNCPCGSGRKYKSCCLGKIPWETLSSQPPDVFSNHLTIRGKNLCFINSILGALKFDSFRQTQSFSEIKRAFTPDAVRKIYSAVVDYWPSLDDYERCITSEKDEVTAFYTGSYQPEAVFQAITRHALYSSKIFLVDPFINPTNVQEKYNPLFHPEEHRSNAIKFTFLWLSLLPWIDAGIVNFIRPLHDFVPGLYHEILEIQRKRLEENAELKAVFDEDVKSRVDSTGPFDRGFVEYYFLSHPDSFFIEWFEKRHDESMGTKDDFIDYIHKRRDEHPYYVDPLPGERSQFLQETSGANYELTKRICALTGSHMITDLRSRWKELELDRKHGGVDERCWEPFAKALQSSDLKVLNRIPLQAALQLRKENRLESMRLFFRKTWKSCREPDAFSEENAVNLSAELADKIAESQSEWRRIDQDLLKWFGASSGAIVSSGIVGWVPAASAAAVTGITGLIQAQIKRQSFKDRYPAGFFLGIK